MTPTQLTIADHQHLKKEDMKKIGIIVSLVRDISSISRRLVITFKVHKNSGNKLVKGIIKESHNAR